MVLPGWVEIVRPETSVVFARLDPGKSEAIALAIELSADVVLMDDQTGRREATRQGLRVAGNLKE